MIIFFLVFFESKLEIKEIAYKVTTVTLLKEILKINDLIITNVKILLYLDFFTQFPWRFRKQLFLSIDF